MQRKTKNAQPSEKLKQSIAKLLIFFEEFGYFVLQWNIQETKNVPSMATDYRHLYFNPDFITGLKEDEIAAVVIHEVVHCIFLHPTEIDRVMREGKDPVLWTVAQEMVTNAETIKLVQSRNAGFTLPGTPISPFKSLVNHASDTHAECYWYDPDWADKDCLEIYVALQKLSNENRQILRDVMAPRLTVLSGINRDKDGEPEKDGKDGKFLGGDVIPCKDKEAMQEAVEKVIAIAKKALQKGDLPLGMKRHVQKLLASRTPWNRILQAFVNRIVMEAEDYRWDVPNFKHPLAKEVVLPGHAKDEIGDIVVVVDTSGSISDEQIKKFASEIAKMKQFVDEIVVYTTDAQVHEKVKITEVKDILTKLEFRGGGGTDFRPIFETVKSCTAMVFLTDGYATYPETPPRYPVLWVLTKNNETPPWGKVVHVLEI